MPTPTTFPQTTTTPPQVVAARIAAAIFTVTLLLGLVPLRAVAGVPAHTPATEPVSSPTASGAAADISCRVEVGRPGLETSTNGAVLLAAEVHHGNCLATTNGVGASPDLLTWEAEVQRCLAVSNDCAWRTVDTTSQTRHRSEADLSADLLGEVATDCQPGRQRVRARLTVVVDGDLSTSRWATSPAVDVTTC